MAALVCSSPDRMSWLLASPAGRTAILPFTARAGDTGGLLSICEFTLGPWESGPVLHMHTPIDEAFYVVAGQLELQLNDQRRQAAAGRFVWVSRGTAHAFANAGAEPLHVLALAVPGEVEELFVEQAPTSPASKARPTPRCWTRSVPNTAPRRWDPRSALTGPPPHRDDTTSRGRGDPRGDPSPAQAGAAGADQPQGRTA